MVRTKKTHSGDSSFEVIVRLQDVHRNDSAGGSERTLARCRECQHTQAKSQHPMPVPPKDIATLCKYTRTE